MNRRQFVTSAASAASAASLAGAGLSPVAAGSVPVQAKKSEPDESAPLSLSIVPSRFSSGDSKNDPYANYSVKGAIRLPLTMRCLNVLIRNRSRKVVSIWDEGNSWGFDNLHLEVLGMTEHLLGKIEPWAEPVIVRRSGVSWGGNGPGVCPLPPGEALVRNVELPTDPDRIPNPLSPWAYLGFPLPREVFSMKMRLRAVLTIPEEPTAREFGVWTGRIVSPVGVYLFEQQPAARPGEKKGE